VPLAVRDWGTRPYVDALQEMRRLRGQRRKGAIPDTLLLVEHPSVITVGVQGADGDELPEGIPVIPVERGGKSTYHGPGQLVAYPIVDLEPRGRDVRRFVHDLEELVVRALATIDLPTARLAGKRGVWVGGERKIASVGISVEEWVTMHGLALNVSTDLAIFRRFRPCGFDGSVMTSVESELGRPVKVRDLHPAVIEAWTELFGDSPSSSPLGQSPTVATSP
jgi:lipoate-protein ligase B